MFQRKITFISCLTLIILFFNSCIRKMALQYMGVYDSVATTKKITNEDKEIVFIGMHHLGKQAFYDDVIKKLNALKAEGYFTFYEGVGLGNFKDTLELNNLFLKFRSLTGIDMYKMKNNSGYIDTLNGVSLLPDKKLNKIIQKEKFVNQPKELRAKYDTINGKNVDGNLKDNIKAYEDKFGIITLTDYDKKTPLGATFDISKNPKISTKKRLFLMLDARNYILANELLKSTQKKIVIIYGKAHYKGLLQILQLTNKGFVETK